MPLLVTSTHVLVSPYTKVEESFTLHAIHDVLAHGLDVAKWDHVQFPGAVPRSFALPIMQAFLSWPVVKLATWVGAVRTKLGIQVLSECKALLSQKGRSQWRRRRSQAASVRLRRREQRGLPSS